MLSILSFLFLSFSFLRVFLFVCLKGSFLPTWAARLTSPFPCFLLTNVDIIADNFCCNELLLFLSVLIKLMSKSNTMCHKKLLAIFADLLDKYFYDYACVLSGI